LGHGLGKARGVGVALAAGALASYTCAAQDPARASLHARLTRRLALPQGLRCARRASLPEAADPARDGSPKASAWTLTTRTAPRGRHTHEPTRPLLLAAA
jgi:hypothetical protein